MGLAHMGAYSSPGRHRSLWAPLDPAVIDLLSITNVDAKRYHFSRFCCLFGLQNEKRGVPCSDVPPLGLETKAAEAMVLSSWASDHGSGNPLMPFGQRQAHRYRWIWLGDGSLDEFI